MDERVLSCAVEGGFCMTIYTIDLQYVARVDHSHSTQLKANPAVDVAKIACCLA